VYDAVALCAPDFGRLKLKWPNDLLLDDKKVAGLLIESESRPFAVAIGIGVNCRTHPAGTAYPATDLTGADVAPLDLLSALATAMNHRLDQWGAGAGFASIRADWLARAAGLGGPIKVRLPERQLNGVFEGIDESGQLLLTTDTTTQAIAAGEVFALGDG